MDKVIYWSLCGEREELESRKVGKILVVETKQAEMEEWSEC